MEDEIILSIQDKLATTSAKYIDEDWGQLDYYSPAPVKFPCVLIDIVSANYQNLGMDKAATPANRQTAEATVSLTIANQKLTNSSHKAPMTQKNAAFEVKRLKQEIHAALHGWNPTAECSKLIRTSFQRIKRDDGIQEYAVNYSFAMTNC